VLTASARSILCVSTAAIECSAADNAIGVQLCRGLSSGCLLVLGLSLGLVRSGWPAASTAHHTATAAAISIATAATARPSAASLASGAAVSSRSCLASRDRSGALLQPVHGRSALSFILNSSNLILTDCSCVISAYLRSYVPSGDKWM
jgi:hypothetical protein